MKNLGESYNFIKELGDGKFGKVMLASDTNNNGALVAVKVMKKEQFELSYLKEIQNEVEIMKKLNGHKNVITLINHGQVEDEHFICMELAAKGDLHEHLMKNEYLEENEARKVFQQIVDGVGHMHAHGVCHRDLKLENIFLAEDDVVKIGDFGLSEDVSDGNQLKIGAGTQSYVAPEILKV